MEPQPKRQRRNDHDSDETPTLGDLAESHLRAHHGNAFDGTGIQSAGNFTVSGDLHINVNKFTREQEEGIRKQRQDVAIRDQRQEVATSNQRQREEEIEKQRQKEKKEKRKNLLKSLESSQMHARESGIRDAHGSTCRWILTTHQYERWARRRQDVGSDRFIWLKGKPGAGKSTMMKFLLGHLRRQLVSPNGNGNEVIISFFFNARGAGSEKTTLGLYRSLLSQLLREQPGVREVLDSLEPYHEWTIVSLESTFKQAVLLLEDVAVTCLIDALDECEGSQARDMVQFFKELTQTNDHLRVCFASRHYPNISIVTRLEIILEHQPEHQNDITKYLISRLQIGNGPLIDQIRSEILRKSSGIFMWVVLVVEILNREYDAGKKHRLRERLNQIPEGLHEIFRDILTRDTKNKEGLLLCIQWISFARRPLTPKELYFAIISGLEPEYLQVCHVEETSEDDIRKYILNNSKGLAEPIGVHRATVQFIHESVVDFLIKDNGIAIILSDLDGDIEGKSHNSLKICCLKYIESVDSIVSRHEHETATIHDLPFFKYAQEEFVFHAEQAERCCVDQKDFMADFEKGKWIWPPTSPLYRLAQKRAAFLIRAHPTDHSCFTIDQAEYAMPIMEVLAAGMTDTALALLEMELYRASTLSFHSLCDAVPHPNLRDIVPARTYSFRNDAEASVELARVAPELVSIVFFRTTENLVDICDRAGLTALNHAISTNRLILLEHLIDLGADLSFRDREGGLPTHWAAKHGTIGAFAILARYGCKIDGRDDNGRTPLHFAVYTNSEVTEYIVTHMANFDIKDNQGQTPLHYAVARGLSSAVLDMLLDHGADVDACDSEGRTPLHYAVRLDHMTICEKLLSNKADMWAADNEGQTPLKYALWRHRSNPPRISQIIEVMRKVDVDVSSVGETGETILHWCAGLGLYHCVNQLVNHGAAVCKPDRNRYTPIWWAVYSSTPDDGLIHLLISRGANIQDPDQDGYTLLHRAVEQQKLDVVRVLLGRGASRTAVNKHGQSPLDLASSSGFAEISRMFSLHNQR